MEKLLENRKGFTLIELLAVIVILAVLILVATPAVTQLMQKAQASSFRTEALTFAQNMETAYADKSINGSNPVETTLKSGTLYHITPTTGNGYDYLCMNLTDLQTGGYVNKNLNGYTGYIQYYVTTDSTTGTATTSTYINITNGKFYITSHLAKGTGGVSKSDYVPSTTDNRGGKVLCPTDSTKIADTLNTVEK